MPGRELAANYDVNNLGNERLESQDSVHLQLTPRAVDVLKQLSRVGSVDFAEDELSRTTEILYAGWRLSARYIFRFQTQPSSASFRTGSPESCKARAGKLGLLAGGCFRFASGGRQPVFGRSPNNLIGP